MHRLSFDEQDRLHSAVDSASEKVAAGMHPTEAVRKAASMRDLPPGGASLVATALNVGRQMAQRGVNREPIDKFASFELADPDGPDSAYVGDCDKHADYDAPPAWAKAASAEGTKSRLLHAESYSFMRGPSKSVSPVGLMLRKRADWRLLQGEARLAHYAAEQSLLKAAAALHEPGWTPPQVKTAVEAAFNPSARDVVKMAFNRAGLDYDETPIARSTPKLTPAAGPFPAFRKLCADVALCLDFDSKLAAEEAELEKAAAAIAPIVGTLLPKEEEEEESEKISGLLQLGTMQMAGNLIPKAMPAPISRDDRVDEVKSMADSLESPSFETERRAIAARAILAEALSDEHDPIAGYDPDVVLRGFNEIAQIAPNATANAVSLKPMLRRWLAGNQQPHEIGQFVDLEQKTRAANSDGAEKISFVIDME